MSHAYRIPELADVSVAADVLGHVRSSIEFQLGHFRVPGGDVRASGLPRITVAPYSTFRGEGAVQFHSARGADRSLLHQPVSRHATLRTDDGFAVFSDTPEVLIVLLLQALALRRGVTFLHAAGWCDSRGEATLVPGPGGVGKTALVSAAVLRHGARLLGDDLVRVGAGGAAAFPRAFVLKEYHRSIFPDTFAEAAPPEARLASLRRCGVRFLRENAPFHGVLKLLFRRAGSLDSASLWLQQNSELPELHTVPVARLFDVERIAENGPIRRVVYLERHDGEFRLDPFDQEAVVRRSVAVLHHEWADYLRWFCALGALELIDIAECFRRAESAMRDAFCQAEIMRFQVPLSASPEQLEEAWVEQIGFEVQPE